ncbi:MAG: TonB-dependent receptor [Bryobacterales bacterium]
MGNRIYLFLCIFVCIALLAPGSMPAQDATVSGTITGTIFDAANGEPIRQATVQVEGHAEFQAVTGLDGSYQLKVPPGTYAVRISSPNHLAAALDGIVVEAGGIVDGSTVMAVAGEVTTVDVVERIDAVAATADTMIAERRLAPVVSDGISGEEIRSSTADDAAGALEKVTGVSVVEGGYVYVRGLGERYSTTMLNNAMLPTTEPDRRVVPLDLFPANLIDSLKVLKTYTPDLPGEFSGGLVQMQTVEFPTAPTFTGGMSFGFNDRTTFGRGDTYRGGSRDFFGFDDGTRDIPSIIPADDRIFPGRYTPEELQEFGRAFPVNWEPEPVDSMRPSMSYNMSGGGTFGKLGIVGAITFTNKPQRYSELQRFLVNTGGGQAGILTDYPDFIADQESVRMGGVFNIAYSLTPANKFIFRNTLTRETDKEARTFRGLNGRIDSMIQNERMRWIERGLYSTGVEGQHSVQQLGNSLFKWQFTYSTSNRDEPDLREIVRSFNENGSTPFLALPQSATRFSNTLEDRIYEPLVEWSKPLYGGGVSAIIKFGFRGTFREREFAARRFRYIPLRLSEIDLDAPNNELLGPDNITPTLFQIRENTRGTDQYTADMDVYAGFGMIDLALGSRWRIITGVRVEDADIRVETIDPLIPGAVPQIAQLKNRDPLPGVNVIYSITPQQNLRFAYGRTLSRPDFRELSPFDFVNVLGGFSFAGNPNLVRAKIDNFDARWEWFFGGNQLFALSYFYKDFTDPIEVTIQPTTGDLRQTYINAKGAQNQGVEVEFRRRLDFLHPKLAQFSLQTNFTMVDSNVEIGEDQRLLLTSLERRLTGQSRYIYNIIAEWARPQWRSNARFYANYVSRRITDVGAVGLPDIYQESNTFLDFVYQFNLKENGKWSIRFTAENMLDNHYQWTQADILQRSYRLGRTYSVGTSFSFF